MTPLSKSIILIAASVGIIIACKKERVNADVQLTSQDSGKTTSVSNGETIALTVGNPGDGGYQFIDPKFDSSVLILNSHTHQPPKDSKMIGDFGTDTWKFTAIANGKTMLTVSASRGSRDTISIFTNQITVK